ncbi:hypothetical protein ACHQM5_009593 [Ranunculus cassubicifolius]
MVKQWNHGGLVGGIEGEGIGNVLIILIWGVLVTLSLVSFIIFSCSDGASKEKDSVVDSHIYGSSCGGACGA